jgi:hypothetical protein
VCVHVCVCIRVCACVCVCVRERERERERERVCITALAGTPTWHVCPLESFPCVFASLALIKKYVVQPCYVTAVYPPTNTHTHTRVYTRVTLGALVKA